MKNKPMTQAERTAKNYRKNKDSGLIQAKVWVHPSEAEQVRAFAKEQPKTNTILMRIKSKLKKLGVL